MMPSFRLRGILEAFAFTLMFSGAASAQGGECLIGADIWVDACPSLSVTAQWNEDAENDCTYNPPTGYTILETKVAVHSSSSGSHSVNTLAGGSSFATERMFSEARKALLDGTASYRDASGESRYAAKIENSVQSYMQSARRFEATNNTIYATVSASGSGDWFSKKRGWEDITVKARLLCLGAPDKTTLVRQIAKTLSLPRLAPVLPFQIPVVIENLCNQGIFPGVVFTESNGNLSDVKYYNKVAPHSSGVVFPQTGGRTAMSNGRDEIFVFAVTEDEKIAWSGTEGSTGSRKFEFKEYGELWFFRPTLTHDPKSGGAGGLWKVRLRCE